MRRGIRRQLVAAIAVAALTATGCAGPAQQPAAENPSSGGAIGDVDAAVPAKLVDEIDLDAREAKLKEIVAGVGGGMTGIAVADAAGVSAAGVEGVHSAWSTIKVPIAIAAEQLGVGSESLLEAAITESDNDASTLLWNSLGGAKTAAHAVEQLLWRAGSKASIRNVVVNNPDAPYGNAVWPIVEQAKFATRLHCLDGAASTYTAMGEIAPWQQDGLGRVEGSHFKGGWSKESVPEDGVTYTYRQFGTVAVGAGQVGVAVIAHPADGTHASAAAMLDELALELDKLRDEGDWEPIVACA